MDVANYENFDPASQILFDLFDSSNQSVSNETIESLREKLLETEGSTVAMDTLELAIQGDFGLPRESRSLKLLSFSSEASTTTNVLMASVEAIDYIVKKGTLVARRNNSTPPAEEKITVEFYLQGGNGRAPMYVAGNIPELGGWNLEYALKLADRGFLRGGQKWSKSIQVSPNTKIFYKYFQMYPDWENRMNDHELDATHNVTVTDFYSSNF